MNHLLASCAKAGIVEADSMLTGATQVNKKAVNKFPDDGYPRRIGVLYRLTKTRLK